MSTVDLQGVVRAVRQARDAETRLIEAIRATHHEGASLRELAIAAGKSHETIRRIVAD